MHRIIYSSQATRALGHEELDQLIHHARERNEAAGVTGMLLYCNQSFLQLLEGEGDAVRATYGRVAGDRRHAGLRVLLDEPVPTHRFPGFWMGFEHIDADELVHTLPGYTTDISHPLTDQHLIATAGIAQTLIAQHSEHMVG